MVRTVEKNSKAKCSFSWDLIEMEIMLKSVLRLFIFNVHSTSFTSFPFLNKQFSHHQTSSVTFNITSIDYQRMSATTGLHGNYHEKNYKNNNNNNNNKLQTPKPEVWSQLKTLT